MYCLKKISMNDGREIYDMLQGIETEENGFNNDVKDMPYQDFADWVKKRVGFSEGVGLPNGWVPFTTYWLFYKDIPVGCGRIRHPINEELREGAGHIGYAVSKPYRGLGHGNILFELLLEQCKQEGIKEAFIRVSRTNERSNKVVNRYGGKLRRKDEINNYYIITLA